MPITLTCPECDQAMKVQDDVDVGSFNCPRCGAKVYLGDPDEADRLEEEEEARKKRRVKKGKKKRRERVEGLSAVSRGLGFHYAGVLVFMAALWAYWLAVAIMLACMFTGLPDVHALGFLRDILFIAVIISAVATMLEVPAGILCLFVPDGSCKALALGSLSLRIIMILVGVWYVLAERDSTPAILNGLVLIGAFFLWMSYLRRLAFFIEQRELARDVVRVIVQAVCAALAILTFLFFLALMVRLLIVVQSPFGRAMVVASIAGPLAALVAACFKLSGGDSVLKIVLYPTGIPFLLRYLELVSSLRLALLRRT